MEESPCIQGQTSEDSGLGESSQYESNPLFTPVISTVSSRKRKILEYQNSKHTNRQGTESIESSPWTVSANILSSTMNDSITTGVEKCNLESFAANYYTERSDCDISMDTSSFFKKIKEPSTPTKRTIRKFYNAKASPRRSPLLKLGSPERNGILYPSLQPNTSRFSDSKHSSPAKKRLFTPTSRKDPVTFFWGEKRNMYHVVILKIFSSLLDEDLYTCSKVCKGWKKAVSFDDNLKRRLQLFVKNKIMNKENDSPYLSVSLTPFRHNQLKQSTPIEEPRMFDVTNSLTEGQHLEKCITCRKPVAIVDKNISQCTSYRCGVIRCLKCNSISKTGPENFVDSCQQSMLLVEKPPSKYSLLGSPKRPPIFSEDTHNTSQSMNSSGYMTDMEISQSNRHSLSFGKGKGDVSQVLKVCNTENTVHSERNNWERRNSIVPVISIRRKIIEIVEPSSPPKERPPAAGTKRSKKNLKRLNL